MATRDYVQTEVRGFGDYAVKVIWTGLLADDDGDPLLAVAFRKMSIQFTGTFGGATIVLQGSNDGTNWVTLDDVEGAALSKSATGMETSGDFSLYVRPKVTGGDGTTALVATLIGGRV